MDVVTNFYPILGSIDEIRTGEKYIRSLKNNNMGGLVNLIEVIGKQKSILQINLIGVYQKQKIISSIKEEREVADFFNDRFNEYLRPSSFIFKDLIAIGYDNDVIEDSMLREFIKDEDIRLRLMPYMQLLTIDFQKKGYFDMQDYLDKIEDLTIGIIMEINSFDPNTTRNIKQLSRAIDHKKKVFEEGIELYNSNLINYGLTLKEYMILSTFKKALDIIKSPDNYSMILPPSEMDFGDLD